MKFTILDLLVATALVAINLAFIQLHPGILSLTLLVTVVYLGVREHSFDRTEVKQILAVLLFLLGATGVICLCGWLTV